MVFRRVAHNHFANSHRTVNEIFATVGIAYELSADYVAQARDHIQDTFRKAWLVQCLDHHLGLQ